METKKSPARPNTELITNCLAATPGLTIPQLVDVTELANKTVWGILNRRKDLFEKNGEGYALKSVDERTAIPAPKESKTTPVIASNVAAKTIIVSLRIGKPSMSAKVNSEIADTMADKTALHISKDLLQGVELRAIRQFDSAAGNWLRSRCLPLNFREGIHLLPEELITDVDERLVAMESERQKLIESFLGSYPERKAEAKKRLKDLFDLAEYPEVNKLRQAFYFEVRYLSLDTPTKLKDIKASIFRREAEKANRFWAEAAEEVQAALRGAMAKMVDHLVDKLRDTPDGKKKAIHKSSVKKLEEFLTLFKARNITDDKQLATLVEKAQAIVGGTSLDLLKKDASIKEKVLSSFEGIKKSLDKMIVDRPKRAISFEEE